MRRTPRAVVLTIGMTLALACGEDARTPAPPAPPAPAAPPAEATPPPETGPVPVADAPVREGEIDVRFGLDLAADGTLLTPVLSFGAGDPVCLSVRLPAGSAGSSLGLRWFDVADAELGQATAALAGSPPRAALRLPGSERLGAGTYRIELTADGRPLGEASFSISDLRQTESSPGV